MEKVRITTDPPVRDEDEAGEAHAVDVVLQGPPQSQVIQGVAGEGLDGDGDALIVHEQSHLDNGELPFLLADAVLALSLLQDVPFFIQDVLIRLPDLEIKVGHIIINDVRGTAGLFYKVCVDAADYLIFIGKKEVQGIKYIVRVVGAEDRLIIVLVLAHSGGLGSGA